MTTQDKTLLVVVDDLMFTVKISDAAKRAGLLPQFVKSEQDVLDKAKQKPLLIILDLNAGSVQPLDLIAKLKEHPETKDVNLLAYLSHVQGELKQQAHDAGADMVMTRSAFSQNLPQILKRHAGVM
jgi:CheY-like chemotaxis protein